MKLVNSCITLAQVVVLVLGGFVDFTNQAIAQSAFVSNGQVELSSPNVQSPAFRPNQRAQVRIGLPNAYSTSADRLVVQPKVQIGTAVEMADPIGGSEKEYRACAEAIHRGVMALLNASLVAERAQERRADP